MIKYKNYILKHQHFLMLKTHKVLKIHYLTII